VELKLWNLEVEHGRTLPDFGGDEGRVSHLYRVVRNCKLDERGQTVVFKQFAL